MSWQKTKIENLYLGLYDGPHATPKPSETGPVFLGIKNITNDGQLDLSEIRHISEEDYPRWTKRVTPRPNDIVFTYEATLNRYAIIPDGFRGCLGRRIALIRPDFSKIDTRFLFYYFFGDEWRATVTKNIIPGSTVDRIPLVNFPNFKVTIPPLPTQRKIAAVLSAYDDLIENNTRRIAILEEMAQLLYREWFVHFRFPGHEDVEMIEIQDYLINNGGTIPKVTTIPKGWQLKHLGDIAKQVRRNIKPDDIAPNTPYIGLGHMPKKSIALTQWGTAEETRSSKLIFRQGEILFGKIRPYFHKVGITVINGVCSTDALVIIPKKPIYFSLVLTCVSSVAFVEHATQTSQGTKMPRADWKVMIEYPIVIPPKSILIRFNELIQDIVTQIQNLVLRNRNLRTTRDLLLPRLISGEIDISNLDIATGNNL